MMTWSSRYTLIAGLALIAVANAVALIGVAYNRSDTGSVLHLTQRELTPPYQWRGTHENSGLALRLQWRVLQEETAGSHYLSWGNVSSGGAPAWLDKAKLETLGFAGTQLEITGKVRDSIQKQLSKEVLLVLELDGPIYQTSLDRVRRYAERQAAKDPKEAKNILEREQSINSRLFAADAGLDAAALRTKYPDHSRYAIVRGRVRPQLLDGTHPAKPFGYISDISIDEISVPFIFREVFDFVQQEIVTNQRNLIPPYEVTVTFGKRLEPWITAASKKK